MLKSKLSRLIQLIPRENASGMTWLQIGSIVKQIRSFAIHPKNHEQVRLRINAVERYVTAKEVGAAIYELSAITALLPD